MSEETIESPALKDFKDILPPTFKDEKGGNYMIDVLSQRRFLKERPLKEGESDNFLFLQLQTNKMYGFDGRSFKTFEVDDITNGGEGFSGVIAVTGPLTEGDSSVMRALTSVITPLKPGAPFFLFEKPEGPLQKPKDFVDKDWRLEELKKFGLVEVNILNSGRKVSGSILWEAHFPRNGALEEPINILDAGPYYVKGMLGDMKARLSSQGWDVMDFENSELAKKLRKTKFPLKEIHTIRDGFGVKVKSNQCQTGQCEGVIPIDTGELELSNSCGEDHPLTTQEHKDSEEIQTNKKEGVNVNIKHEDGETITLDRTCLYCGDHLKGFFFSEGKGPQQMQISCPHDGFVELKTA